MRGLINFLERTADRLRDMHNRQHIADLEQRLSDLVNARTAIDAEIETTAIRLLEAQLHHEEHQRKKPYPLSVDRAFPDIAPRSY